MATNYKMTWRTEQGGRWRKRYKGKDRYFPRKPGESKEASYHRCLAEWLKLKEQLDGFETGKTRWHKGLTVLIRRTKARLLELQAEDTPQNRAWWTHWKGILDLYQWHFDNGVDIFDDDTDIEDPPDLNRALWPDGIVDETPPPWESAKPITEDTIGSNVQRFLDRKARQVKKGERSASRYDALQTGLERFAEFAGVSRPIESIGSPLLSRLRDDLEAKVDRKELSAYSARDRLQAVKQFVKWAWEQELIELPRILKSSELSIPIPEQQVQTFTDEEVTMLLQSSSESTRLYLLLMLNCGMTQVDISDLEKSEVDWKSGRLQRKRSKTRKGKQNGNVPVVDYKLWPETFALLKNFQSDDATRALTNANGQPLKVEVIVDGRVRKIDNIRSAYSRVQMKLKKAGTPIPKPLKLFRKTAATKLGGHSAHGKFTQHFLGHAPGTVADRHYISPSKAQFDKALGWLRKQFDLSSKIRS